jgi:phosphomevalonate kinase
MIATAPGKLILTGEYAVLDGAPSVVVAVDRRAIARQTTTPHGSSPFLLAVADEIAARRGAADPATRAALAITVDSKAFYDKITKLGLGSSAAVTVAATALALGTVDRELVLAVALAAHARAQGPRGARGSGADIAASVYGGTIVFTRTDAPGALAAASAEPIGCRVERRRWPASVTLVPFFTGAAADTASLVARVQAARDTNRPAVEAALAAITDASRAACAALAAPADIAAVALIGALALAANAMDRLALATAIHLVPACVSAARAAMASLGGTAKTTGAGGGDVGIAVIPATIDATLVSRLLIEAGCQPLRVALDDTGVDLHADAS